MINWYDITPVFVQNWLISLYGHYWKKRRYGGIFKEQLIQFKKREGFTKKQWHDYQTTELRKLLVHAYTTVPYYSRVYSENGFKLTDFQNFELSQLENLPILEKDELRKFGSSELLSIKRKKGVFYSSSGSTGTPTQIYFSKQFHQKYSALYEARVRQWASLDFNMPRGMIGGRRIIKSAKNNPPFYRFNKAEKQTYFSAYHISEQNAKNYLKGIKNNKVAYMVGYAMSNYLLANLFESLDLKVPRLKAVITSSEKLTSQMREKLFSLDSGIMEVIDKFEKPVSNGETGEIIATGLLNFDQPLIRYKIGDFIRLSKNQHNILGTNMLRVEGIEGRTEDVIIGKHGQKMVRFHGIFVGIPSLKLAQVIQHKLDKIEIKLVVSSDFSSKEENTILDRMKSQLGNVNIYFNYVSEILNNKNGKYQAVISKINHNN